MKHPQDTRIRISPRMAALLLVVLVSGGCLASASLKPPFVVPFTLGTAGAIAQAKFRVTEPQRYSASLQYEFKEGDAQDRARAWRLAGGSVNEGLGKWSETGAQLELKVLVSRADAENVSLLVSEVVRSPRLTSWGGHSLKATLVEFSLNPGTYKVSVESLHAAPTFRNEPVFVLVGAAHRGK